MEKLNIAELIKDYPSGMELNCTAYDDVYFDYIDEESGLIHCYVQNENFRTAILFDKYGCYTSGAKAKCVIFPKGKTTWEGFVPPLQFKDGDIAAYDCSSLETQVFIVSGGDSKKLMKCYVSLFEDGELEIDTENYYVNRYATEEEKQKLFDAIKTNGYKWNPETKTLEKLIEPKFKVGDKIVKRNSVSNSWIVSSVNSEYYGLKLPLGGESIGVLSVSEQDNYELLLNTKKFDISTLKPFESRVLVRSTDDDIWRPAIYGFAYSDRYYIVGGVYWKQCVPYIENNQHLLGTTNDCDEYFKTWE